jgi:hypothetical protein
MECVLGSVPFLWHRLGIGAQRPLPLLQKDRCERARCKFDFTRGSTTEFQYQAGPMRFVSVAASIPADSVGVYIAFPTSVTLKPTYRGHKTLANSEHTKVGIARRSFASRQRQYLATFRSEVAFFPILALPALLLPAFETEVLREVKRLYQKSGRAREWFHTTERQALAELIWSMSAGARLLIAADAVSEISSS